MTQSVTSRANLRILIVEDHVLFAESLELALSVEGYDVRRVPVPCEERAPGALAASVVRLRPRVVLLDLDLGGFGDGVRLIAPLARLIDGKATTRSGSKAVTWPRPSQLGQAPTGELNENRRGSSSGSE